MTHTAPQQQAQLQRSVLRLSDVLALLPISRSTWWRGVKSGRYPKPIKLGARITAWRADDIRRLTATTTEAGDA